MTLDDLPMVVPMAESVGPEVRPLDESEPVADEYDPDDVFGTEVTSIGRPSPLAEVAADDLLATADPSATTQAPTPPTPALSDLTRPGAAETSPLEHAPVTDETIREAFPEALTPEDAAELVPAGPGPAAYTFDPALTVVI